MDGRKRLLSLIDGYAHAAYEQGRTLEREERDQNHDFTKSSREWAEEQERYRNSIVQTLKDEGV